MIKREPKKTECPECHEMIGSQGLGLHRLHKHGVSRKQKEHKDPEPEIIEEIMKEEPKEQPTIEEPKPEPKPEPAKEVSKPEPVKKGDEKPAKGQSFLDWLFGDDEEKSSPDAGSKKEDDDWW